jgi:hypothetical protein
VPRTTDRRSIERLRQLELSFCGASRASCTWCALSAVSNGILRNEVCLTNGAHWIRVVRFSHCRAGGARRFESVLPCAQPMLRPVTAAVFELGQSDLPKSSLDAVTLDRTRPRFDFGR